MNIALQKLKQTEGLILGEIKEKIKEYLKIKYNNIPYDYALLKVSNKELINNSYVHLNDESLSDMDGIIFKNLDEGNYITLIYYHFKDNFGSFGSNALRIIGDIEYEANSELIKELKQEAISKIIKTSGMQHFSNAVVYLSDKCTEYNLQNKYINFLGYAKQYFLKEEEKKIDDIILAESTRIKVEKEEQQEQVLDKQGKIKAILNKKETVEKEL